MTNYTAPLKFRAWDKKRKVMLHAYQLTFALRGGVAIAPVQSGKVDAVLMQSTGLPDKNGKEIFGGDIVRVDVWTDNYVGLVEYYEYGFVCLEQHGVTAARGNRLSSLDGADIEIIGNVFQSPGLLEGEV